MIYAPQNHHCLTAGEKIASWKCGKLPLMPMENLFTAHEKGPALSHNTSGTDRLLTFPQRLQLQISVRSFPIRHASGSTGRDSVLRQTRGKKTPNYKHCHKKGRKHSPRITGTLYFRFRI